MKFAKVIATTALVLTGVIHGSITVVHAQITLTGKYSGTYTVLGRSGDRQFGLELTIISVENEAVKGTLLRHGALCTGEFQLEGTLKGNQLVLRSNKAGSAGDCTSNFRLEVSEGKLSGTMGSFRTELSK